MPARLAEVASRSPSLCGECKTCKAAGDVFRRFREYVSNLEDDEPETSRGAVEWMERAYPPCPTNFKQQEK